MTVGKRISSSFKRTRPEVCLGDTLSQSEKKENPILKLMKKKIVDRIRIARIWPDFYQFSAMKNSKLYKRRLSPTGKKSSSLDDDDDCCQFDVGRSS